MLRFAALLLATFAAFSASGGTCDPRPLACGDVVTGRIEDPDHCRFSDTLAPFLWYMAEGVSGMVFTIDVTSAEFDPRINIYRRSGGSPIARAIGGGGSAQLKFDVVHSSPYPIAVSAVDGRTSGAFTMRLSCEQLCRAPFSSTPTTAMTVSRGEVVLLPFLADGTPGLRWRWFDAADPSVTLSTNPGYFITPPMQESATFNVTVSNACGEMTRPAAIVTVSDCVGAHIVEPPRDVTVAPGGTAAVTVLAGGKGPLVYSWYEGAPPQTANQLYDQTGPTLTLHNVKKDATYWVRVANACGLENSAAVRVFVVEARRRTVRH